MLLQPDEKAQINEWLDSIKQGRIARRIAFLMAWHPRLGAASGISRVLGKDIGRLIARYYMHEPDRIWNQTKLEVWRATNPRKWAKNAVLILARHPRRTPLGIHICPVVFVRKDMSIGGRITVQTNACTVDVMGDNLLAIGMGEDEATLKMMKNLDKRIRITAEKMFDARFAERRAVLGYVSPIVRRLMKLKLRERQSPPAMLYIQKRDAAGELLEPSLVGELGSTTELLGSQMRSGDRLKLILECTGAWYHYHTGHIGPIWIIRQALIVTSKPQTCDFILSSSDDEE